MICPNCQTELPDGFKFCGQCGTKLERRCPECEAEAPEGFAFCGQCGTPLSGEEAGGSSAEPAAPAPPKRPAPVPPPPPSGRPDSLSTTRMIRGERRRVTIVFADLVGFTTYSEARDVEEVTLTINRLMRDFGAVVERYGGYVDKFMGDAIMALFGAPTAHENDPERAVRAGLTMLEIVQREREATGEPLGLRVGIHTGMVIAGAIGGGRASDYTVTGDAANTAARLETAADANTVLVSEEVYRSVRDLVEAEKTDPLELKGKSETVEAWFVRSIRQEATRRVHRTPFVDRRDEIARLESAAGVARDGSARFVVVHGEAGIGKSRLTSEFLETIDETWTVLATETDPFGAAPFGPLRELALEALDRLVGVEPIEGIAERVESALGAEHEDLADEILELADLPFTEPEPSTPMDAEGRSRNRQLALVLTLQALARREPVAVFIEDLHRVAPDAMELLTGLARQTTSEPILYLATTRETGTAETALDGTTDLVSLRLAPLDAEGCREMVEKLAPDADLPVDQLIDRSGGNPLFLEELIGAGERDGEMPESVQSLLLARLDQLASGPRAVIRLGAVLGTRFRRHVLEDLYGRASDADSFDADVTQLVERQILLEPDMTTLAFQHSLVREVAYATELKQERRRMHRWAGEAIERLEPDSATRTSQLAHHYSEAAAWKEALPHLVAAGTQALEQYAVRDAEKWLEAAAIATDRADVELDVDRREKLWDALAQSRIHRGEVQGALEAAGALADLAEETGSDHTAARAQFLLGWAHAVLGDQEVARERFQTGLDAIPDDEPELRALLLNALGATAGQARLEEGEEHLARALEIYEELDDRLGQAKALLNRGNLLLEQDVEEAKRSYERALALGREIPDRVVLTLNLQHLALIRLLHGEYRDALEGFAESRDYASQMGMSAYVAMIDENIGRCHLSLGELDRAAGSFRNTAETTEGIQAAFAALYLGRVYYAAFDNERARTHWERVREEVGDRSHPELEAELHLIDGRLACMERDHEAAETSFRSALELPRIDDYLDLVVIATGYLWSVRARTRGEAPPSESDWPDVAERAQLGAWLDYRAGRAYRLLGDFARARELLERATGTFDEREMTLLGRHAHWEAHLTTTADPADPESAGLHLERARELTVFVSERLPPESSRETFLEHDHTRAILGETIAGKPDR